MFRLFDLRAFARSTLAAAVLAAAGGQAAAGEFFEKDGAAIRGYDPVAYFVEDRAAKGSAQFKAAYKGSTFHFVSQQNRDRFAADPGRFAPQYGGFCAFGMAGGYKAAVDPEAFRVVDGRLYLNYNHEIQARWAKDIPGFIDKADRNWPATSTQTRVLE
jgi:YHS domain-containing protein